MLTIKITLFSLLQQYSLFAEGKMVTKSGRQFRSEFLCHHIGHMIAESIFSENPNASFGQTHQPNITLQLMQQWRSKILKQDGPFTRNQMVVETWNEETDFAEVDGLAGNKIIDLNGRIQYRLKCLQKAYKENPELEFEFVQVFQQSQNLR